MPYKVCPNCNKVSYSACDRGEWQCPYCKKDIAFIMSTIKEPKIRNKNIIKKVNHLRLVQ